MDRRDASGGWSAATRSTSSSTCRSNLESSSVLALARRQALDHEAVYTDVGFAESWTIRRMVAW